MDDGCNTIAFYHDGEPGWYKFRLPRPLLLAGEGPWEYASTFQQAFAFMPCGCSGKIIEWGDQDDHRAHVRECIECGATWTPGYDVQENYR